MDISSLGKEQRRREAVHGNVGWTGIKDSDIVPRTFVSAYGPVFDK